MNKLDLGCGKKCPEDFDGVDIAPLGQSWVLDLQKFPWPFANDTYDELRSSHFVEHLPARDVEGRDIIGTSPEHFANYIGKDFLFAFFDECHRILKRGGTMRVIVPCGRSTGAFQDPTHRRFIMRETFYYLDRDWRVANGLDHYRTNSDFEIIIGGALQPKPDSELRMGLKYAENTVEWNFYSEWRATLVKR